VRELAHPIRHSKEFDLVVEGVEEYKEKVEEYKEKDDAHKDFLIATCVIIGCLEFLCEFVEPVDDKVAGSIKF
jgi:hypothetical protein